MALGDLFQQPPPGYLWNDPGMGAVSVAYPDTTTVAAATPPEKPSAGTSKRRASDVAIPAPVAPAGIPGNVAGTTLDPHLSTPVQVIIPGAAGGPAAYTGRSVGNDVPNAVSPTGNAIDQATGLPTSILAGIRASGGAATPAAPTSLSESTPLRTPPAVVPNPLPAGRWDLTTQLPATSGPGINPVPPRASYLDASTDPTTGQPGVGYGGPSQLTRLGKILTILRGAAMGGIVGSTQPTLGTGYLAAQQNANEQARNYQAIQQGAAQTALARMQLAMAPQEFALRKAQLAAQTQMMPLQLELMRAQATAANYKEDPNLGLIDLRTGQPISGAGLAPLTAEEATVLGKQAGDRVPLKLKNTASEIAARGWTTLNTQEGVYDYNRITGEKKRQGSNPREITLEMPQPVFDKEGIDPNTGSKGVETYATRSEINANPSRYAPTKTDLALGVAQQALREYSSTKPGTAGGNALAFNTAIGHIGMLWDAAQALNNGNIILFNRLRQDYAQATGDPAPTNFNTIASAVNAEVAKVFKGGVPADAEIQQQGANTGRFSSPQQLRDNMRDLLGLMASRINALQERYDAIQSQYPQYLQGRQVPLIGKEAQSVIQKIQNQQAPNQGQGGGPPPNRPPLGSFEGGATR